MSKAASLDDLVSRYHELRRQGRTPSAEELCAEHAELLDGFKARLEAEAFIEDFLESAPGNTSGSALGQTPTGERGPGVRAQSDDAFPEIPGYQIDGVLGRGGMGVVYRAWQLNPRRRVALKMILGGHAGPGDRLRLLREAQAQADLEHPHVVRVYEGGEHQGRPFFSLELVEGGNLAQQIAGTPQPARQAAAWLEPLARALHAAHLRGIIHRDLKPSNVLLTADGVPKVTDFGLAKLIEVSATEAHSAGLTPSGIILGTPSYMAPEQAAGDDQAASPAADIYALGAILYECLTGRPPFRGETLLDTVQQVTTQEPVPPSRMQPKVPRDLETICLKCLEKEPRKRYASAAELAEDLGRFQRGEPVRARPVGQLARGWRWCQRNRTVAALLALVAVVLLLGLGVASVLAVVANQQAELARRKATEEEEARKKAEEARDEARGIVELVASEGQLQVLEKQAKLTPEQVKLLKALVDYYERYAREEDARKPEQVRQLSAYYRIAWMQDRLGFQQEALSAYRRALEPCTQLAADYPDEPRHRQYLVRIQNNLGNLLKEQGKLNEALTEYRRALEQQQKLVADHPTAPSHRHDLARTHNNLGNLLVDLRKPAAAVTEYQRALELQAKLAADHPAVPDYLKALAGSHNNLGLVFARSNKPVEAEAEYRRAIELQTKLVADYPAVGTYQQDLVASLNNLGNLLRDLGNTSEAEAAYRRALQWQEQLVADYPTVPEHREGLARCCNNWGILLEESARRPEAEGKYRRALELQEKLAADYPAAPGYTFNVGASYCNLGRFLMDNQRDADGLLCFDKAIATLQPVVAQSPQLGMARLFLRDAHWNRANALTQLRRDAEAFPDWQKALELDDQKQLAIRLGHARGLALRGEAAPAVAAVEGLANDPKATKDTLIRCARVFALASATAKEDARLQEQYAVRAMQLFRHPSLKGDLALLKRLETHDDVKSLRGRADFQRLLEELRAQPVQKP